MDIISDYIYDCVTYEIDIRQCVGNIDYRCFETEEELGEFLENESLDKYDVYIYKASNGIFCEIEWKVIIMDSENVFIESRNTPLCDVPKIAMGNQPIDNGNYLFLEEEKNDFI